MCCIAFHDGHVAIYGVSKLELWLFAINLNILPVLLGHVATMYEVSKLELWLFAINLNILPVLLGPVAIYEVSKLELLQFAINLNILPVLLGPQRFKLQFGQVYEWIFSLSTHIYYRGACYICVPCLILQIKNLLVTCSWRAHSITTSINSMEAAAPDLNPPPPPPSPPPQITTSEAHLRTYLHLGLI